MIKNYIKIAFRNLQKRKGYSFINIFGLTIGLTCCIVIFQYVSFEYSFDRFHENGDDLYRVTSGMARTGEELKAGGAFTPQSMAPALLETVPEIKFATRLHPEYEPALVSNPEQPQRVFEEEEIFYADPEFLTMFTFPLVEGNREAVLEPGTMLVSETMAEKYFDGDNPVGQSLKVTGLIERVYRVTGVFRDVPANSHLQFDFLLPVYDLLRSDQYNNEPEGGWSWNNYLTYIQLHPDADKTVADRKMEEVLVNNRQELINAQQLRVTVKAQPLHDIHLNADVSAPAGIISSYRTVYFFVIIAFVTLLIALVNYINLATARSLDRAREVGVRKVMGAQRDQLIKQFFLESAMTILTAVTLAIGLTEILRPLVSDLTSTQITSITAMGAEFWGVILLIFILSTFFAGLYPALVLSSFKPVSVLKGKTGSVGLHSWLRRGLVVVQFTAAVVLIGGTYVVYNQLEFMRNMDLGFDLEQVLTVSGPRTLPEGTDRGTGMATFVEELQRLSAVQKVAISASLPGQGFNWHGASTRRAEEDPSNTIRGVVTYIDSSFTSLYDIKLIAGSDFSDISASTDSGSPWRIIANETAVQSLGFSNPAEAIDHALVIGDYDARIIGVVEDFNWSSAHESMENVFFGRTTTGRYVSLKVEAGNLPSTIESIKQLYNQLFPGNVFSYRFIDEAFDAQYRNDRRFARLFTFFAAIAIAIACLGLFGLASFIIRQRTKEIGIRKVLGASVPGLVALLSREFLKLVGTAVLIGTAGAYFLMNRWLQDFAYRIEIGPGILLLAGGMTLLIALLTISWQSVRTALMNPVESLRSE